MDMRRTMMTDKKESQMKENEVKEDWEHSSQELEVLEKK